MTDRRKFTPEFKVRVVPEMITDNIMSNSQSNSAEEIRQLEIAYLEALRALDLAAYLSFYHDDMLGWPNGQPAPVDKEALGEAEAIEWVNLQPGSINVEIEALDARAFGDFVINYCKIWLRALLVDGTSIDEHLRYTHTWMRTESGWKIIGGLSAPV